MHSKDWAFVLVEEKNAEWWVGGKGVHTRQDWSAPPRKAGL